MRRKYNKYMTTGLLINGVFLMTREVEVIPEVMKGFLAGMAIFLMMFGIYANCHDVSKMRDRKKQFVKRIFSR